MPEGFREEQGAGQLSWASSLDNKRGHMAPWVLRRALEFLSFRTVPMGFHVAVAGVMVESWLALLSWGQFWALSSILSLQRPDEAPRRAEKAETTKV